MVVDDMLRVLNIVLSVLCVGLMAWRYPVLREQPAAVALLLYTLGVFVAVNGYASAEALITNVPRAGLFVRIPLVTAALVLCLFGLSRFRPHRKDDQ